MGSPPDSVHSGWENDEFWCFGPLIKHCRNLFWGHFISPPIVLPFWYQCLANSGALTFKNRSKGHLRIIVSWSNQLGTVITTPPLPIIRTSNTKQQASTSRHGFRQKKRPVGKVTGKVTRCIAHTRPLQNPDAAANPLRRPPAPPCRPWVAPPRLQPAWLMVGHTKRTFWRWRPGAAHFGLLAGLLGANHAH